MSPVNNSGKTYTTIIDKEIQWDVRVAPKNINGKGNETVTNCHDLKMLAPDGKIRLTDAADMAVNRK
jgi:hypothetical protein